ncbi:von Willebrand factor, type A [Paraglaciecola sp. T6c]|uniref:vWA domain-containing protein n=1 Tax=Pseudoalteromonas atlantica (strain T6c / ATCC BAA-1087) TaxID=3042615 RepID=UPI00005C72CE|nr:VWA domain-containing protein [Paraglaciecola sp. T6c]ABG40181.1 von Willebrand factor, type A [Paraglaciecola sp. T6c]
MFEFAWWWMWFALPLPILVYLLPAKAQVQSAALRVPHLPQGIQNVSKPPTSRKAFLIIATIGWVALVSASARPQWLGEPVSIPAEGRDLMIAVDLSGSMKIDDMQVNGRQVDRLQMIKSVLHDFIQRRIGDRLGLIFFADTAYLQAPLTYDRETVSQLLNESLIGLVGEQTAIGDAIGLAIKRFKSKEESNKVLILLTDGQNTAGNITPEQANELAINNGVTLYTIGVGADQMLVQSIFGSRQVNPSQELDEGMLTTLAESTGGRYFRARDAQSLTEIYSKLDELEPIARESRQMRPLQALYFYPLGLALLISLLLALKPLVSSWLFNLKNARTSKERSQIDV